MEKHCRSYDLMERMAQGEKPYIFHQPPMEGDIFFRGMVHETDGSKIFGPMPKKGEMSYIQHMNMLSSKSCICPKGYEENSPRVVEATSYECVLVIGRLRQLFSSIFWGFELGILCCIHPGLGHSKFKEHAPFNPREEALGDVDESQTGMTALSVAC